LLSGRIARAALVVAGGFMILLMLLFAYLALVSSAQQAPLDRGPAVLPPGLFIRLALICLVVAVVCFFWVRVLSRTTGGNEAEKRK
jgi:hypothetical protein